MLTAAVMRRSGGALAKRVSLASLAMIDQGVVSLCNFLSIYLLARTMPPGEFGVLMLAQTVILLGTSLHNALIVEPQWAIGSSLAHREYASLLRALLPLHLWTALGLAFLILVVGLLISPANGDPALLAELSLVTMAWVAQEFVRRAMYVRSDTPGALANDAVCYLLQLGGIAALVGLGGRPVVSVESALAVFGASSATAALLGVVQLRRRYGEAWLQGDSQQRARHWRARIWRIGKWLIGKNVVGWFGGNGHAWLVAALLGTQALGVYRAAIHLINVINPVRLAAISYLSPRGSRVFHLKGQAALSRWVRRAGMISVACLLPMVFVLIVFPNTILHLAYGNKFAAPELGVILALATVGQVVTFSKFPFEVALTATSQTRWLFIISIVPVVLLFTVGVALIRGLGLLGVPLSALTIAITVWLTTYLTYRRRVHCRSVHVNREVTPL